MGVLLGRSTLCTPETLRDNHVLDPDSSSSPLTTMLGCDLLIVYWIVLIALSWNELWRTCVPVKTKPLVRLTSSALNLEPAIALD